MSGKKLAVIFTSSGASRDVTRERRYRTHAPAAEMLDAAAARSGRPEDLAEFLVGFSKTQSAQCYKIGDGNLGSDQLYVATRDFVMKPLHGAEAFSIIIPKGIRVMYDGDIGQVKIFDMNDFSLTGDTCINVPSDVRNVLYNMRCHHYDHTPPPLPTQAELAQKAAAHATNGLPQDVTVRRISLKPKVS